jgi:hypothetical protein
MVTLLGPDADCETKRRRAVALIAGPIPARHEQLRPSADGLVKCIDELTPMTSFAWRWAAPAKPCVMPWA